MDENKLAAFRLLTDAHRELDDASPDDPDARDAQTNILATLAVLGFGPDVLHYEQTGEFGLGGGVPYAGCDCRICYEERHREPPAGEGGREICEACEQRIDPDDDDTTHWSDYRTCNGSPLGGSEGLVLCRLCAGLGGALPEEDARHFYRTGQVRIAAAVECIVDGGRWGTLTMAEDFGLILTMLDIVAVALGSTWQAIDGGPRVVAED